MKISNHSAVPVYTISGSSTARPLPEWLARKRKRSLKTDHEYASRIELLQDFEFEEASQCIRVSEDGQWVMSTGASRPERPLETHGTELHNADVDVMHIGTYKPQIHTHYLPHLSLSFTRHTNSLNTSFLLLSSDYSKSLHLQADRSLEFHTPQGCHYTTRLPRYGRDLKYDKRSAEALIPSVGVNENGLGEVFRLNLEVGKYMRGFEVDVGGDDFTSSGAGALQGGIGTGSVNAAAVAEGSHNLLAFGTSLGTVEFWDSRSRTRIGTLPALPQTDMIDGKQEITAIEFDQSGINIATGSSTGLIHLYDLRSPKPTLKKDQGYGYPIQDLIFLISSSSTRAQTAEPKIMSADKRIIKIWDARNGTPWTSVEPAVDINCVTWCKDSGMLLTANEGRQQHAFFIPQLGQAPKWCSFLDNLVEEMAEDPNDPNAFTSQRAGDIYDNYKFLTMQQLQVLNLSHLVGTTSLLRPYMHGYFVAQRLYEEAKLIADPFVWEERRNKLVKEKIDAERESRIRGNKKIVAKVNRRLAEKIMDRADKRERRRAHKVLDHHDEKVSEDRDTKVIDDIPNASKNSDGRGDLLADPRFAKLFQDEDFAIDETSREFQSLNPSTKPYTERKESIERGLTAVEREALDEKPASDTDVSESDELPAPIKANGKDKGRISSSSYTRSGHRSKQPQMLVTSSNAPKNARDRSFGSRAERHKTARSAAATVRGEQEITFAPKQKGKAQKSGMPEKRRDEGRRSASGNVFRKM